MLNYDMLLSVKLLLSISLCVLLLAEKLAESKQDRVLAELAVPKP